MKRIIFLSVIALVGCSAPQAPVMDHDGHDMPAHETKGTFAIEDKSIAGELGFKITKDGSIFADYGIGHTKRMHMIVVRDDLTHFSHLHPVQDQDGIWRVPFAPPAGGTYWIYADFIDGKGTPTTLRFTKTYPGPTGDVGFIPLSPVVYKAGDESNGEEIVINEYRVELSTSEVIDGDRTDLTLSLRVEDTAGNIVPTEEYLGAKGHVIILSPEGEFLHVHPTEDYFGNDAEWSAIFAANDVRRADYRIFAQFQVDGQVIVAPLDWRL